MSYPLSFANFISEFFCDSVSCSELDTRTKAKARFFIIVVFAQTKVVISLIYYNSFIRFRKRIPFCARVTSPGLMSCPAPPPMTAGSDAL